MANTINMTLAGALAGLFIYYAWIIAPAATDPNIAESTKQLIEDTRGMLVGFMFSGAFSANAFWFGAK